ncbi:hypothetical protein Cadr_000000313 [Camelus dromedarius]|uniref:Secreted protein n=1 Tax=Camelus dromedarius TaxID=9838 RepID=A0A5N4EJQ6_CAMDR|nr:hypothetical protein Cadr_000000313 [Camelus dromedarius]
MTSLSFIPFILMMEVAKGIALHMSTEIYLDGINPDPITILSTSTPKHTCISPTPEISSDECLHMVGQWWLTVQF